MWDSAFHGLGVPGAGPGAKVGPGGLQLGGLRAQHPPPPKQGLLLLTAFVKHLLGLEEGGGESPEEGAAWLRRLRGWHLLC